jgi:glutathione S-transferase
MPTVKLTYFDLRARAEPCRLLLAYAGTQYEDERLAAPWDDMAPWIALKPKTPWGQVPLLSWDGEVIAQSMACARFLAREFGLAGRTSMEMAQVDEIIDVIQDLLNAWYSLYHAKDTAGQQKYLETNVTTGMGQLEKKLESRGGQFMVGNAFSWADLHIFFYVTDMQLIANKEVDAAFPKIKNLVQRVGSIPNVKAWVESRPASVL